MREQGIKKGIFTKYSKKILAIIAMITIIGGLMPNTMLIADAAPKKASALKLSKTNLEMYVGQKQTLKVTKVTPAKASKAVTWKSSNKKIASVNSKGKVTAKKAGSVKITAVSKSNSKVKVTCKIKVYAKPITIKLNKNKKKLMVGESFDLKVKSVSPKSAYKKVKYKSSKKSVATVNSNGKIQAHGKGTATITVQSVANNKVMAKCKVTVEGKKTTVTPSQSPTAEPTKMPDITSNPEVTVTPSETIQPTITSEPYEEDRKKILVSGSYENTTWSIDTNGLLEVNGTGEMYGFNP